MGKIQYTKVWQVIKSVQTKKYIIKIKHFIKTKKKIKTSKILYIEKKKYIVCLCSIDEPKNYKQIFDWIRVLKI